MELHVRLVDKTKSDAACKMLVPVPDIEVYIWHTDAQGYYSGFGTKGTDDEQKPDITYSGKPGMNDLDTNDRFCRGIQVTDANGVASFLSVFPGWYNGRDLHIHIVCFKKGSTAHGRATYSKSNEKAWIFTTQFYFDPTFSKSVHEAVEPYKTPYEAQRLRRRDGRQRSQQQRPPRDRDQSGQQGRRPNSNGRRPDLSTGRHARPTDEQQAIRRRVAPTGSFAFCRPIQG